MDQRQGKPDCRQVLPEQSGARYDAGKQEVRDAVEDYLIRAFHAYPQNEVCDAARYAVLGGGHRWRPIAAVAAGKIFRPDALEIVLPGACGAELAHSASLVLDDLPSMDNADIRRGKDATHKVFPAWAVDMAPVFLVTMAYDISLANERVSYDRRVKSALVLSKTGLEMIAGQVKDVRQDKSPDEWERLVDLYTLKSGSLYCAAGKAGAILSGANDEDAELIGDACLNLGLSYQFMDDVADVTAGVNEVGKPSGMDAGKFTAIDLFGVEGARRKSEEFQDRGLACLERFGPEAGWLRTLICEASWKAF